MKTVIKIQNLLFLALFIFMLILIGPVTSFACDDCPETTAVTCSEECTAEVWTKISKDRWPYFRLIKEEYQIGIIPDDKGQWPVVVETEGKYSCGDTANYPCLAWPYQVNGGDGDLDKVNKISILIPNCCTKPIKILKTSQEGDPTTLDCLNCESAFENICSGYELQITDILEDGSFWFTTLAIKALLQLT